jgi:hypothetical protein
MSMKMRDIMRIVGCEIIFESARADLYHATGVAGALGILRDGGLRGGNHYDGETAVSLSRDPRWRFYKEPSGEFEGAAPIQFVVDGDALSRRYRTQPYAHSSHTEDADQYPWSASERHINAYEERVITKFIPLSFVKQIRIESTAFPAGWDDPDEDHVVDKTGTIKSAALDEIRRLAAAHGIPIVTPP